LYQPWTIGTSSDKFRWLSDLSELIGLRALRARPRHAHRPPDLSARISQQIRETIARNDAERRRSDGERA